MKTHAASALLLGLAALGCQSPESQPRALNTETASLTPARPNTEDRYAALAGSSFDGGYPASKEASTALNRELFFQRAVQSYLWALPAVNMQAMKEGLGKVSGEGYHVMSVFEQRLEQRTG